MFQFLTKHNQASLWIDQFKAREEKKQALVVPHAAATVGLDNISATTHMPQVIFTRDDAGHNTEETQKIQELYHELEDTPRLPMYAFA